MASSVRSGSIVNVRARNGRELQNVLNVVAPPKNVRESVAHINRVKKAREAFKDLAFKVK